MKVQTQTIKWDSFSCTMQKCDYLKAYRKGDMLVIKHLYGTVRLKFYTDHERNEALALIRESMKIERSTTVVIRALPF